MLLPKVTVARSSGGRDGAILAPSHRDLRWILFQCKVLPTGRLRDMQPSLQSAPTRTPDTPRLGIGAGVSFGASPNP